MKSITIKNTTYKVIEEVNLKKYPNISKYLKKEFYLEGPRGAMYDLMVRHNGTWSLSSVGRGRGYKYREVARGGSFEKIFGSKNPSRRTATTKNAAKGPLRWYKEVKPYRLLTKTGRHIRMATKVILADGREIRFIEKLSKKEAIRQAGILLRRGSEPPLPKKNAQRPCKHNPPRGAVRIYDNILAIEAVKGDDSLWPRELFRHDFKAKKGKAAIYGLPDGSILIKGNKRLWKRFNYPK